jgi:hypothetical protein
MGEGAVGFEREAYYAGWLVVRALAEQGMTLAELSKVEDAIPALVRRGPELAVS